MTSPESPAVQDTDRLREVAADALAIFDTTVELIDLDEDDQPRYLDQADAVLAAVLPVHREMVLGEAAKALEATKPSVKRFWDTNDANRVYVTNDLAKLLRRLAVSAPPTPPGSPPADERATAVEADRGEPERGCPVMVWDGPYSYRCNLGGDGWECAQHGRFGPPTPPAAVPGTGDDPPGTFKLRRRSPEDQARYFSTKLIEVMLEQDQMVRDALRLTLERDEALGRAFAAEDKLDLALVNRAEVIDARNRLAEANARLQVERDDALALVASCTTTQQRRLAETIRRYEPVIKEARNILNRVAETEAVQNGYPQLAGKAADVADRLAALGDIPSPTAPEAGAIRVASLDDVLAALRDADDHRKKLAEYVAQRFAPAEPEGTPDADT